jgi:chromosome segregation ATPase
MDALNETLTPSADTDAGTPADTPPPQADTETSIPGNLAALPAWAQSLIRDLRQESAGRRAEIKRLKDDALRIEGERAHEKFQLESAQQASETLKPRAERADTLDAYIREAVEKRVTALPEAYRTLVPAYADALDTLTWLDANAAVLTSPRAPSLDAGTRGDSTAARISAAEREIAAKMGVTPEQYARAKG